MSKDGISMVTPIGQRKDGNRALPAHDTKAAIVALLEHAERELDSVRTQIQVIASYALTLLQDAERENP